MRTQSVLISGGGIAGSTLAWWLARRGYRPTVVERAEGLRSSGNPVDVRGEAVRVAEQMGIMPSLAEAATNVARMAIVDGDGRRIAVVDLRGRRRPGTSADVEVARGDLAAILTGAARSEAEFVFQDAISSLHQDPGGVDVLFESGRRGRFDLVVGADGLHSAVRRVVFGPEEGFVRPLGMFVATLRLDDAHGVDADEVVMYNTPGRSLSVHPAGGDPIAAFIFRSPRVGGLDHRDPAAARQFVIDAYAGGRWRTDELLEKVRATDDLYFDAVSRVVLPAWSRGRVVLLGDAASSISLFGEGSSMAMIGARTLAEVLAARPDDHAGAFASYQSIHARRVRPHQKNATAASRILVPSTAFGIAVRNAGAKVVGGRGDERRQASVRGSEVPEGSSRHW